MKTPGSLSGAEAGQLAVFAFELDYGLLAGISVRLLGMRMYGAVTMLLLGQRDSVISEARSSLQNGVRTTMEGPPHAPTVVSCVDDGMTALALLVSA